jgi:hypothetical protein
MDNVTWLTSTSGHTLTWCWWQEVRLALSSSPIDGTTVSHTMVRQYALSKVASITFTPSCIQHSKQLKIRGLNLAKVSLLTTFVRISTNMSSVPIALMTICPLVAWNDDIWCWCAWSLVLFWYSWHLLLAQQLQCYLQTVCISSLAWHFFSITPLAIFPSTWSRKVGSLL